MMKPVKLCVHVSVSIYTNLTDLVHFWVDNKIECCPLQKLCMESYPNFKIYKINPKNRLRLLQYYNKTTFSTDKRERPISFTSKIDGKV